MQEDTELTEVLAQWEPKVSSFLRTLKIRGVEREDAAQELRISIIKAWRKFDKTKGVKFHTYLHVSMLNAIRALANKSNRTPDLDSIERMSETEGLSNKEPEDLSAIEFLEDVEIEDLLFRSQLTKVEVDFLNLKIQGFSNDEIRKVIKVNDLSSLLESIKRKVSRDEFV